MGLGIDVWLVGLGVWIEDRACLDAGVYETVKTGSWFDAIVGFGWEV